MARVLVAAMLGLLIAQDPAIAEAGRSIVDLEPRPGVTLRVLIDAPETPAGAVILFSGGGGVVAIGEEGTISQGQGNFLVRTRQSWLEQGFLTAVVDAPSDWHNWQGLGAFRFAAAHANDIAAVIRLVRGRTDRPLWLVGTSRGTLSVVNVASRLQTGGPDGIVLTSTMLDTGRGRDDVFLQDLDSIRLPVLIVHHREDGCIATPARMVPKLAAALVNAPKVDTLLFEGGAPPRGDPCEPFSRHGFLGIEQRVIEDIGRWIKANGRQGG
ncbi:MAG: alpha/beta hydrolase [Proteobacteria bacterium]|nr:alpha/beta hydrolase [Pseudomonadota bacterium]MBI3499875.1 alpha/beta hydrolase [Pseudomonadota bacterium]